MHCILIFDHFNDILFTKCDKKFSTHIEKLAKNQGLLIEEKESEANAAKLSPNILIQLFSPVVTSQQIMSSQFGNSYTSVQCQDGTNIVFDEFMGYLFVHVGLEEVNTLKRLLSICICFVQHLCGPDVTQLKSSANRSQLLTNLLDTWCVLSDRDQSFLVEAVEQLTVSAELSLTVIKTLRDAINKLKALLEHPRSHALIFVDNKFLSLYSSREADELAPADILFLNILTELYHHTPAGKPLSSNSELEENSSEEFFSPESSPQHIVKPTEEHVEPSEKENVSAASESLSSHLVLLCGSGAFSPHAVHIFTLAEGVSLLLLCQTGNEMICSGLHDAFSSIVTLQNIQLGDGADTSISRAIEILEGAIKRIFDTLKKNKSMMTPQIEAVSKDIHSKWEFIHKKYNEYMREKESGAGLEATYSSLVKSLRHLLHLTCLDKGVVGKTYKAASPVADQVRTSLADFTHFLKIKAIHNFSLGSRTSLTINKYLEEFPGLVHFLYIDRTNHRVITPSLDFTSEETVTLTKKKIWSMVEYSRLHLQDGHLAVMWKDTTFNYAFYLWFEDTTGSPLKPRVCPTIAVKSLPIPGVLCGDFYQRLVELCFPKSAPGKVRCFELYCIHLGLATSSCVLEHSRRLAATIYEVTGITNNPVDLL